MEVEIKNERLKRVNSLVQKELANIFLKETDFSGFLLTITRVETSANFQQAKVYLSVLPDEATDKVFDFLNKNIYSFQKKLNRRLKMRPVPKIILVKEEKTKQAAKIEKLLKEVKKKNDFG